VSDTELRRQLVGRMGGLRKSLKYIPETGELIWLYSEQRPDVIGKRAGWFDASTGYWKISIDGVNYIAARIIWFLAYGVLPERTPDHRDNDKSNDRLCNLRLATKSENGANAKLNIRNTCGLKGVSFCRSTGRYRASIQVRGKSVNLGRFNSKEEAHSAYLTAAIKEFGEFARAK
jgi:hypothetical protein